MRAMFKFGGLEMLKMLRLGASGAIFIATAVIKLDGMGICMTALASRLVLTRMRELRVWFEGSVG